MSKTICVFSGSSERVEESYFEAAGELGRRMASSGWRLVFGGGTIGLMGAVARGVHEHGGHVTAVIPERLNRPGVVYETADEIVVTETLRERKHIMDERADAFVALPGGFGTLEEIIEVLTLKQLRYHDRPVLFLNTLGYYDTLVAFFHQQVREHFVKSEHQALYEVAATPEAVVDHITAYVPVELPEKFDEPA